MADNVAITAGAGTDVATDDVAGVHYQRVKLVDGTLDSTAAIPGDATNGLDVDVTRVQGSVAVTNAGTFAVQDSEKLADDAAFTPATTKVTPVGYLADDTSTDLVDEGDAAAARITLDRKQIVMLGESGANQVKGGGSQTGTADQSIMAAGGAGVYNYLCWVTIYNSSATNSYCNIKDGATVVAVLPLPAYGGAIFQPPHPIRGTANTAWNVASGTSLATAYYYGGGFKATA